MRLSIPVTLMRGWLATASAARMRASRAGRPKLSLRGLPGVTSHQTQSRPSRVSATRLACRWPPCGGLKLPPNKPIRMPGAKGGRRSALGMGRSVKSRGNLLPRPDVDEMPGNRGGRGHLRRDEMGAALVALPPLEIAVRSRGAALARPELVGVHGEAHRAAGLAPIEARGLEDPVEALRLGLDLHEARAGHDHRVHGRADALALDDPGDRPQVLDAAIGAGADEHPVRPDVLDPLAALEAHIGERPLDLGALVLVGRVL